MLVDDGFLREAADGIWQAADDSPTSGSRPRSVRSSRPASRALAPEERAVAERASVVGRVFEQAAVVELATEALRREVGPIAAGLVRKELIRPEHTEPAAGDAFKFRHILIRDAAYDAIPKAERALLHERFADWLERPLGDASRSTTRSLAYHLEQAYRYRIELGERGEYVETLSARAGGRLAAAGQRALKRGDIPAAAILLSRATNALPAGSPARLKLQPDLGFALFTLGRVAEADALLRTAIDEAGAAEQPLLAIHADLERALLKTLSAGEHRAPRQTAKSSIPQLERAGDDPGLVLAHLVIASAAWMSGQVEQAEAARGHALEIAGRTGEDLSTRWNSFWGAECYGPAPAVAAIERLERTLASNPGDDLGHAQTLFALSGLYAMRGRAEEAREAYQGVRAILEELGAQLWAASTAEIGGVAELIIGDPIRAQQWLEDGIVRLEGLGATGYLSTMLAIKGEALAYQGKATEALASIDRSLKMGSPEDALLPHVAAQTGRAVALHSVGDIGGAIEAGEHAVRSAETTDWISYHADALLALAPALVDSGQHGRAIETLTRALELYRVKEHLIGEQRAVRLLDRLSKRGVAAMTPCPSCGHANPERARFCAECGTALAPAPASRRRSELPVPGARPRPPTPPLVRRPRPRARCARRSPSCSPTWPARRTSARSSTPRPCAPCWGATSRS